MKNVLWFLFTFIIGVAQAQQDSIVRRVIFIGDAGEINHEQETLIPDAATYIITGKTTVLYLGDNIYPNGMGLPGSVEEETTQQILRSQYEPMREKGAAVYFIPGNHDWDRMNKLGLKKIKAQWQFLHNQKDSLLHLVPQNGCPDPVEIPLSDSMVIIAYDSEWWLFPHDKENTNANCSCTTQEEVIMRMDSLFYKNRNKVILLAGHHPFTSYGVHGGHFDWKDHIFPFTTLNDKLYIPLPIIGSLYPLLRSTFFLNPEDIRHPEYRQMIDEVDDVFGKFPNITFVAGHEHGLQLIKNKERLQIVSGAGAKHEYTKKGKYTLYANATQGFVIADLLIDKSMRYTYYAYSKEGIVAQYTYIKTYQAIETSSDTTLKNDSVVAQANAQYYDVTGFHRALFGKGFRKEWAAKETLPLLKISTISGGLIPTSRGGGMQSTSLRLVDSTGVEWVIRSVNKNPDALLPEELRQTFTRDWLDDATSSQHPYSALMVPPLAQAVGVPCAEPVIGVIAPDTALGIYSDLFDNTLCLLEKREPLGKSDNSEKMLRNLQKDNDNTFDAKEFLRARMLDMLINDWDRHEDQWRWKNISTGKDKQYIAIPRDRDQALRLNGGALPYMASRRWVMPTIQGFRSRISNPYYAIYKSRFLNAHPASQFSYEEWMNETYVFTTAMTDSLLEASVSELPDSSYKIGHDKILSTLQKRRDNITEAMSDYYKFINKIVDIYVSDKNEFIKIESTPEKAVRITIRKINKDGQIKDLLMDKVYDPKITKQIRIYTGKGEDSLYVDNKQSSIKIRVISNEGVKAYNVIASKHKIKLYAKTNGNEFYGEPKRLNKHLSDDSTHTTFVPVNLYNTLAPVVTGGYNVDDGLLLGGGFRYIHQESFRKLPYSSMHQLQGMASIKSGAFRIRYKSEWIKIIGKTDLTIEGRFYTPNVQNFFGLGNDTKFEKTGDYKTYYHVQYGIYQITPALRWRSVDKKSSISIGPSAQFYHLSDEENAGRFVSNTLLIGSYDSLTLNKNKLFVGAIIDYIKDTRNNLLFPTGGFYFRVKVQAYAGMNNYSENFVQVIPELNIYKSIDGHKRIVIANRIGGGMTAGKTAFYQSLFLGGHENLWGYRQYRFAGTQSLYNNFELRIRMAQIGNYILPGQFGLIGFYDAGKVWAEGHNSSTIHMGYGGGIYFIPAQIAVFQLVAGHSTEGWLPYCTMNFRF